MDDTKTQGADKTHPVGLSKEQRANYVRLALDHWLQYRRGSRVIVVKFDGGGAGEPQTDYVRFWYWDQVEAVLAKQFHPEIASGPIAKIITHYVDGLSLESFVGWQISAPPAERAARLSRLLRATVLVPLESHLESKGWTPEKRFFEEA